MLGQATETEKILLCKLQRLEFRWVFEAGTYGNQSNQGLCNLGLSKGSGDEDECKLKERIKGGWLAVHGV